MRKWIEEYGEFLLTGVVGSLIIALLTMSGVLSVIGNRGKMEENSYEQYQDFNAFSELCQREKPEISYQADKQWYAGETISIEEAFAGQDGNGNPIDVEVSSITDRSGNSYMDAYEREANKVVFQRAGIYMFELKAQDKQKLSVVRKIEIPVDNRKVAQ